MAQSYRSKFLAVLRSNEARMTALFKALSASITADIQRAAGADGLVPRAATVDLQRSIATKTTAFFLGVNRQGQAAPFEVGANGTVVPLSPYMRTLWAGIVEAMRIPVTQHATMLDTRLPMNMAARMRRAYVNPFQASRVQEQLFRPNVLATYEPPHLWVDPNGYRLSDRIWNTADATRRRLDAFLSDSVAKGRGALAMAKDLEAFLQPGRQLQRTNAPYGTDASYDAMRLARTEIARAHAQAAEMSAAMNPFVQGLKWNLSGSHPRPDVCDDNAASGPYELGNTPTMPAHPHCVMPGQLVETDCGYLPIEQIKAGDKVLTHQARYRTVVAAWSTPHDGPVYEFRTERGSFELTGNHPVLTAHGWTEAHALQVGDQVLYALPNIALDLSLRKTKDAPAFRAQDCIAGSVKISADVMPAAPIAFDGNLNGGQSEVGKVSPDLEFPLVNESEFIKSGGHGDFQGARISEAQFTASQEHGQQAGVIDAFGFRDFACNIGAFSGIILPTKIETETRFSHLVASRFESGPVVLLPTSSNGVAPVTHGYGVHFEQSAQHAKGDAVTLKNLDTRQALNCVNVVQEFSEGSVLFGFDFGNVEFEDGKAVGHGMQMGNASHLRTAKVASNHTDNLLSLSPDFRWGAESGNSVVGGVMTSTQALTYYSTVQEKKQRHYTGPVYNMEVEDDNSYTVNGAAVHNCLCYWTYVMVEDGRRVLVQLHEDIQRARAEFVDKVGPLAANQFLQMLLGQGLQVLAQ